MDLDCTYWQVIGRRKVRKLLKDRGRIWSVIMEQHRIESLRMKDEVVALGQKP